MSIIHYHCLSLSRLASNFLVPNGYSFSSMKSAPHQASYTSTLDHLATYIQTLKRERKGGEALSYTYTYCFCHEFPFIHLCLMSAHTCILKRGEKECPKDDEAYNVHLLCILRHWYRYTIEQFLEKKWRLEEKEKEIYSIKVKC
jgi:hypothetical protein